MSYSKKRRGVRIIEIDGSLFRWRFHPSGNDSRLSLQGSVSSGQYLTLLLLGWCDPWLSISIPDFVENGKVVSTKSVNEPKIITPRFVRQAVIHGLMNGWNPNDGGPPLFCVYTNGVFSKLSSHLDELLIGKSE